VTDSSELQDKLELLKLAKRLGNVSRACKQLGYSRDSFYRFRDLFEGGGKKGLLKSMRRKPNPKNRVGSEIERAVLLLSSKNPTWGAARVSQELGRSNVTISPFGIRNIWTRHGFSARTRSAPMAAGKPVDRRTRSLSKTLSHANERLAVNGRPRSRQRAGTVGKPRGKANSETASTILKAALELFASKNYSTVTIKDIAHATGMNAALIYYYFGNKEGLFLKVVESTTRDAINTFEAIRDDKASPRDIVSTWIENHILQFDLMQKLIKISPDYANTRNRTAQIDREIRKFYDIEAKILGSAIRAGIAQGLFAAVDVARISRFTSTFLDGVLVRSAMMRELDVRSTIIDLKNLVLSQLDKAPRQPSSRAGNKSTFV